MNRRAFSDAELLDMLDRKAAGEPISSIGRSYGVGRNTIAGLLHRMTHRQGSAHDGTMPDGWWRDGLSKRGCE